MKKEINLLFKGIVAVLFLALFVVRGSAALETYSFIHPNSMMDYYSEGYYTLLVIDMILIAFQALGFLIVAIGCLTISKKTMLTGFYVLFFAYLGTIVLIHQTRINNTDIMIYLLTLAVVVYAILMLMSMKLPYRARILGVLASIEYVGATIYYYVEKSEGNYDSFIESISQNMLYMLLITISAAFFGFWYYHINMSQKSIDKKNSDSN